jgi:homocysteine S-methyltransferase
VPSERRVRVAPAPEPPPPSDEPGEEDPNTLRAKLRRGEFVVSVELDPPRGLNPRKAIEGAAQLRDVGVDCINIGDSPMATVRMSALGLALLLIKHTGVEPIIHCTPRDRNLMALQSDLLGAHANGVRNVIAVTGDPPRQGQTAGATTVWDVDAIGLIAMLKRFNQGIDLAGRSIGRRASFHVACAVTPVADDVERELDRLRQKIEAGADFVMSQPLWSMEQLLEFERRAGKLPVPHVLGILPLESFKHAELLHHEVPGMVVPDDVRERMRRAGERGREVGLELTHEFIEQARRHVQGVYIITSYGRYDVAIDLVRGLKLPLPAA